jgi:hypothetical protein
MFYHPLKSLILNRAISHGRLPIIEATPINGEAPWGCSKWLEEHRHRHPGKREEMSGLSKAVLLLAGVSTAHGFAPSSMHAPGASTLGRARPGDSVCTRAGAVSGLGMESTRRDGGAIMGLRMRTAGGDAGSAPVGKDPFSVVKVTHACSPFCPRASVCVAGRRETRPIVGRKRWQEGMKMCAIGGRSSNHLGCCRAAASCHDLHGDVCHIHPSIRACQAWQNRP